MSRSKCTKLTFEMEFITKMTVFQQIEWQSYVHVTNGNFWHLYNSCTVDVCLQTGVKPWCYATKLSCAHCVPWVQSSFLMSQHCFASPWDRQISMSKVTHWKFFCGLHFLLCYFTIRWQKVQKEGVNGRHWLCLLCSQACENSADSRNSTDFHVT